METLTMDSDFELLRDNIDKLHEPSLNTSISDVHIPEAINITRAKMESIKAFWRYLIFKFIPSQMHI